MIWQILHIIDITLWVIILGSVAYVVFFAIISLFYEKEDRVAIHAAALTNRMTKFLILYPAYNEDRVIINAVEHFLEQDYPADLRDAGRDAVRKPEQGEQGDLQQQYDGNVRHRLAGHSRSDDRTTCLRQRRT